jgi:hypothetical protein
MNDTVTIELSATNCVNLVTLIHESVRLLNMDDMLIESAAFVVHEITEKITDDQITYAEAEIKTLLQLRDLGIKTDKRDDKNDNQHN